ncbi:hypothetical protein EYZ11_009822 [Aspergillus tanneri]|uniref:Uncharacterized protein n=1 Tax=Aspergillus tanneri TaxID=1220188 RepID=A0A4S3JCA1_9EURO|nr:hypothetical protein EYZ11_009822 [Aspergillus tanneri]
MFRTVPRMAGFVFRENRVPYYQRLFQQHDGQRQWWQVSYSTDRLLCLLWEQISNIGCLKTKRSKYVLYPYLISVYGMGIATTYAMCRMVLVGAPFLFQYSPPDSASESLAITY